MAIYIDPPLWPAHGTVWSHLVSDSSYDELHEFATRLRLPRRAFDMDHYDVPAKLFEVALSLGATPIGSRNLVERLRASGLRVRRVDRDEVRPVRRRQFLREEWIRLGEISGAVRSIEAQDRWDQLGVEILHRWNESHRTYHDERHLEDVLLSLDHLATRGEPLRVETLLAAWFHDAIYEGVPGEDEQRSAQLAVSTLAEFGLRPAVVRHVGDLIVATTPTLVVADVPASLAHLLDADLSIFAAPPARYEQYATSVREEYGHVPLPEFRRGRALILRGYMDLPAIYRTPSAQELWETRARENLANEYRLLTAEP